MSYGYHRDNISALDAMSEAQRIAFAPQLFQAAVNLRDYGILSFLDECGEPGAPLNDIISAVDLNRYAVDVLLDAGLSGRLVFLKNDHYFLTKTGHHLIHDRMRRVNMDFTQDVRYQGMFHLNAALAQSRTAGLKVFGNWPTIYPALDVLPAKVQQAGLLSIIFTRMRHFRLHCPTPFSMVPGCGMTSAIIPANGRCSATMTTRMSA